MDNFGDIFIQMSPFFASLRKALTIGGIQLCFPRIPLPLKVLLITPFILFGCAQQPSREQVAIWSYFLEQCKNEGIANTIDAMQGCITLKERQANSSGNGDVLQALGYTLMQGSRIQPQTIDCHTTSLVGGYRTVCY